jgi:hypothetical protein
VDQRDVIRASWPRPAASRSSARRRTRGDRATAWCGGCSTSATRSSPSTRTRAAGPRHRRPPLARRRGAGPIDLVDVFRRAEHAPDVARAGGRGRREGAVAAAGGAIGGGAGDRRGRGAALRRGRVPRRRGRPLGPPAPPTCLTPTSSAGGADRSAIEEHARRREGEPRLAARPHQPVARTRSLGDRGARAAPGGGSLEAADRDGGSAPAEQRLGHPHRVDGPLDLVDAHEVGAPQDREHGRGQAAVDPRRGARAARPASRR